MKLAMGVLVAAFLSTAALGGSTPRSYWFLMNDDQTWCGYADEKKFQAQAEEVKPLESARLTLASGVPSEITYQIQPESGDWVIADKYSILPKVMKVKRATIFVQSGIEVIQEGDVRTGAASPLKITSVKNLKGQPASSENLDYPDLPIKTNISAFPFVSLAETMYKKSLPRLCDKAVRR